MNKLREVVIVSACRTPIGAFGGSLKDVKGPVLAQTVMQEALKRAKVDGSVVGDVRFGCCFSDVNALNVARVAALMSGIPDTTPAITVNRVCTSGMSCLQDGAIAIGAGLQDCVMVGGVENMSSAPYILPSARWGTRLQDGACYDALTRGLHVGSHHVPYPLDGPEEKFRGKPYIMGLTAEFVARKYGITREEQDELALRSHRSVEAATTEGRFEAEIVPITYKKKKKQVTVAADEHFRKDLKIEELQSLPGAFIPKGGTVTAGNSSGINDGASAILLMSRQKANELGVKPLATVTGVAMGGCAPEIMGCSPVAAVKNLMAAQGTKIDDYDLAELHEAFAAQYIACEKDLEMDRSKTNVNGSGIGLGHPVGSSGSRVIVSLLHEMQRSGKKRGLAAICGGGGVSTATEIVLE
jgi:acetyl-CoA C-acetyltransferase|uniref:Acetyl-CoA acetyltransferase n=1 Tax=Eutreptiella gymnastica TaxID=73025 RepID=A0A7S4CP49_9EUGL|eukprot:CAMPEP_0174284700 /NCGR_PEP_ID=MMETSP0809-20121228/6329_1 /TAXON_ID=73025 ORGANISM="Eutreptiella gymnastica-like, Strain CCMP1594" /NCGR_SAMPLE_ID=MMETSP0809 /ASSEMBLY_ACC=CAM_ASM_000658 /LENGTH=411 /DNA_ID=CAMNT_0015380297 /DNA_START=15 /DNA_END=1250 /DNA_ORIENTATION=-